jgi:hypothetical protein|tara:strand:+ start:604 stop:789 length:186 start_codon:yes stop_codon:yes gene_type:complete
MPKGKGYGQFGETFGDADDYLYNSSSPENNADMAAKAKSDAAWLRSTALGNQAHGGRPFGK